MGAIALIQQGPGDGSAQFHPPQRHNLAALFCGGHDRINISGFIRIQKYASGRVFLLYWRLESRTQVTLTKQFSVSYSLNQMISQPNPGFSRLLVAEV
ncbi:MAG: hypothetical protein D6742_15475 [Cyanobacteria bacterium J069]|nr:MAG: hypothetical protein D6742_15475 [Cyanobacteria bacterium J069]